MCLEPLDAYGGEFPAHEIEPFTELFWRRIQAWRADNPPGGQTAPAAAGGPA